MPTVSVPPMSSFHLRPADRDASPSTSTSTTSDRSPAPRLARSASQPHWSPPALRDVDLPDNAPPRSKFPAPPTGHDLMALFPPAPPAALLAGPTSGYFEREERAFFARAGRELVRVRLELDVDPKQPHRAQPRASQHPPPHHAMPHHAMGPPPHPMEGKQELAPPPPPPEDDESWRRPMPHNERRRAGKHTKRVIVK